ncbi:MAG: flavodoxin-dependent (E)-4-hydroxy-3-methylbut-2-enyl-diphosphate synthase [Thermodesulfobacteriota bacterium]|nr:flavodoxin-dependent (E)-4-hydroxy-3-methylbut-2-enyl-diphosphate synthase [Thermodesulfobacteriota bacterium]
MKRRVTRQISVGTVKVGGGAVISVQSMTNTDTRDPQSTIAQIRRLESVGCDLVRVAVPDMEAAEKLGEIKRDITIPLVADIHFDYRLALRAVKGGVDGLRINPGNIGGKAKVRSVVEAVRERQLPIRIGVNSGSIEKELLSKYGRPTPEAMVESALNHIKILEALEFYDTKISLKASNVPDTIEAYRLISEKVDYPLHLGITEAGTSFAGAIKSSVGIGILLNEGIGDTLRVSLTADPIDEVRAGYEILKALKLRERGVNIISCPTCGRCEIDLIHLANEIEARLAHITHPIDVAIMGCVVNGPGEAKEADIGIAGGRGTGLLFKKGKAMRKIKEKELADVFIEEVEMMAENL